MRMKDKAFGVRQADDFGARDVFVMVMLAARETFFTEEDRVDDGHPME